MFKVWLAHEIVDCNCISQSALHSIFKNCKVIAKHEYNSETEINKFCEITEPHYHALGLPKFVTQKPFRDISEATLKNNGIELTSQERNLFLGNKRRIHIRTPQHYDNALKYIMKYEILFHDEQLNFDFNIKSEGIEMDVAFERILDEIKPKKLSDEMIARFNEEFPTEISWRKALLQAPIKSKKDTTSDLFVQLERARGLMIRNENLTEEELNILTNDHYEFCNMLNTIMDKLTAHQAINMDNGSVLILCGPSGSYKSNICQIIGKFYGDMVTMSGNDFVSTDLLKLDTAVKKQADVINIEEMPWRNAAKRISLKDTLNTLKAMTTGNPIEVRCAKNSRNSDAIMQVKLILISMNESEECSFRDLKSMINDTQEYKRRMVLLHMNELNYANVKKRTNFKNDNLFIKYLKQNY